MRCRCPECRHLDRRGPNDGFQLMLYPPSPPMTHVWFWRSKLGERKGQLCRVVARGKMNSIDVEFEDGFRVITSRHAVRRRP